MELFKKIAASLKPLKEDEKSAIEKLGKYLSAKRLSLIKQLLKEKKIYFERLSLSASLAEGLEIPQLKSLTDEVDVSEVNDDIKKAAFKELFKLFSKKAFETITSFIAPNINGMEYAKQAVALQLFSKQPLHILLLGDPGTGKTDVLRSVFQLSPISSFGLGSGTSGVGLVATIKGDKIMKGLLPMADNGICCIDELNLMKEENRAGLYNAMEKGFVTYDKGGAHERFDSRCRVLATANPIGDTFTGKNVDKLKKELPFDSALLTRFHLVFMIRKPDLEKFKKIAEKIVAQKKQDLIEGDIFLIKSYIDYTMSLDVSDIDKPLQQKIVAFVTELKKNESKYLTEISPRQIIGIMRMCKALARLRAKDKADNSDFEIVKEIFEASLSVE
jgi:replicative DNA helicase Mcm